MVVSSGSMIKPFPSDSTARSGRFNHLSFSSDAKILKALVLQKMRDNNWSEKLSFSENQAAFTEEIALSRKFRAELCHCISDKLRNGRRKASDRLSILLGYCFLHSRHIPHSEDAQERRERQVEEANAKTLFGACNGE